ncbi:MAG: bacteriohemerythrin [bacterium]
MAINWNKNLETGIPTIDSQHKELFKRINEVLDFSNKSRETINETVRFLQSYIVNHFGTEERLMSRANYPEYSVHKNEHERYTKEFNALKDKIEKEGIGVSISVQMNHLLID